MAVAQMEWSQAARRQEDQEHHDAAVRGFLAGLRYRTLMAIHSNRSDYALVQDKKFLEWTKKYAADEQLFFKE